MLPLYGSAAAATPQWVLGNLASSQETRSVVFVDADSLKSRDDRVTFRSVEYRESAAQGFDEIRATSVADCAEMKLTVVRATAFLGRKLVGFSSAPQEGEFYGEQSATHWLIRHVCDRDFLSAPVGNTALRSAELFAKAWAPVPQTFDFTVSRPEDTTTWATQKGLKTGVVASR